MLFTLCILLLFATAAPACAHTITGLTECLQTTGYQLCNDQWNAASGDGSQSATLVSTSGGAVSWSTTWKWGNSVNSVKTFANIESTESKSVKLSAINTAPTTWKWYYKTDLTGIRADIAYDIWLGSPQSGIPASTDSSYEIMIWLSNLGGVQPIGTLLTSNISLAGHTWNLWGGTNKNWNVLSFVVTPSGATNFSADLNVFFDYLVDTQGVPSSQYLHAIQAGTEPFAGAATLLTTKYSVSLT